MFFDDLIRTANTAKDASSQRMAVDDFVKSVWKQFDPSRRVDLFMMASDETSGNCEMLRRAGFSGLAMMAGLLRSNEERVAVNVYVVMKGFYDAAKSRAVHNLFKLESKMPDNALKAKAFLTIAKYGFDVEQRTRAAEMFIQVVNQPTVLMHEKFKLYNDALEVDSRSPLYHLAFPELARLPNQSAHIANNQPLIPHLHMALAAKLPELSGA